MKKLMRTFALLAVAALGLSACNDDKLVPDNGNADGKFVTVHFGAEASIEGATKATLTTEDEKTFKSAWENGDALSVKYSFDYGATKETTATWSADKSCFEAQMEGGKGNWIYDALYPAPNAEGAVDFGSARTQKGNAYNSKYDLMKGSAAAEGADAGMTKDGKKIVFEMTRQTAIAYFHLTSTLNEEVVSAKLSVEGATAYLSTSEVKANEDYAKGYAFTKTEGVASKEINLTFDAGTAPKTSDFKLWFNVLPTDYDKMTLTVETANHTLTISRNATGKYEAGKLYKVVKNIPADKWFEKGGETPVESSYKIEFNSTTKLVNAINASTMASTFVVTGAEYLEAQPFSNPSNAYYGGNETNGLPLRIGKKDASGSITMALSKAGQVNATKIILSAKQFTENKTFAIGVNGSTKQQPGDDYTVLEFPLDGSPLTSIKLDSDGYIFIQSITVVSGPVDNTIPSLSVDQTSKVWAADATDAFVVKVTVNAKADWTVTPETLSWATIVVDKAAGTITVTPKGANETETANEATLTVTHASEATLKAEISLKQNGKGTKTYTLQFGTPHNTNDANISSYSKSWDATRDGFTWTLANWNNNNNNGWTYVRAGSKKADSVATITTNTTMREAISTVTMTIDAINATYVNLIKLEVLSADEKTVKETINASKLVKGDCVFNITNPQKDCKYKIIVDCKQNTAKNGNNGFVQVSKVVYTNN